MLARQGPRPQWCPGRTAIRRHRRGGLSATRPRARLAIFCQSFVGISPAEATNIGRRSTGGRRQVGARRPSFLPGKRRLAGLTPKHPLPISCECRSCQGVLCGKRMVCFCANQFLPRFRTSTQELHYGEESKEKESEEEEVIFCLGVATATHEIGGWTCPAAFCLRDMHFDGHLGFSPISALIRPISASSSAPIAGLACSGWQRRPARLFALLAPAASMP